MLDFKSLSSNQRLALNVFIPFLYLLPLLVAWFSPKNFGFGYPALVPFALAVGLIGLVLVIVAVVGLGKSLKVLPGADELVTRGIYRCLRHPVYVGLFLTLFGLLFACGSTFGMIYLIVVVVPLNIFRARAEENALLEKFGEDYRSYRKRTRF